MDRRIGTIVGIIVAVVLLASAAQPPAAGAAGTGRVYLLEERLRLLQGYVERYANSHYNYYPPVSVVRKGGELPAPLWPINPWTGTAMKRGTGIGDFVYATSPNRLAYSITSRYPGGTLRVHRDIPYTRKMQNDHRTREGLELVRQFIEMWARAHDDTYPTVDQVDRDGSVGRQDNISYWPHDPWFHTPMAQSTRWGDFTYFVNADRTSYSLTAHYSRGGASTLRGSTVTNPWHLQRQALRDLALTNAGYVLQGFILRHLAGEGSLPPAGSLTAAGLGATYGFWPDDPFAGGPLTSGTQPGQFTYEVTGDVFRLTLHRAAGDLVITGP
jgi:hypothetical protein